MDLLQKVDKKGKPLLVYMDAEFQTFRLPDINGGNALENAGFVRTPYYYGMKPTNHGQSNYHFLLSFGYIVVYPNGYREYNIILLPSIFDLSSPLFSNGQLLEPGYTTCKPATADAIAKKRWNPNYKDEKFPFYNQLTTENRKAIFLEINDLYNSSIEPVEMIMSLSSLQYFFENIVPYALLVHKGQNDLNALRNTAHLYGLYTGDMTTRDLDQVMFKLPGLNSRKLDSIQEYFVHPPPSSEQRILKNMDSLLLLRETVLSDIRNYFITLWGKDAAKIATHNPLVDCVYAMIMDLGLSVL